MPPKKNNAVGVLLHQENEKLKAQLDMKADELVEKNRRIRKLAADLKQEKLKSTHLTIQLYGHATKNLQPKVWIKKLKLTGYKLPEETEYDNDQSKDKSMETSGSLTSGNSQEPNAQKPNPKRQSSDIESDQNKKQKKDQNQKTLVLSESQESSSKPQVDNDPGQALVKGGTLEEDLYLSTSSSDQSSDTSASVESSVSNSSDNNNNTSHSSNTDNDEEKVSLDPHGPSSSSATKKPDGATTRNISGDQSDSEKESTDSSLDSIQKLNSMILFDRCAFCDKELPCSCRID